MVRVTLISSAQRLVNIQVNVQYLCHCTPTTNNCLFPFCWALPHSAPNLSVPNFFYLFYMHTYTYICVYGLETVLRFSPFSFMNDKEHRPCPVFFSLSKCIMWYRDPDSLSTYTGFCRWPSSILFWRSTRSNKRNYIILRTKIVVSCSVHAE